MSVGSSPAAPRGGRSIGGEVNSTQTPATRRSGYQVSVMTTAGQGRIYAVVSPAGVPLYSFSDRHAAELEAAVLNESPAALSPRARVAPSPLR